MLIEVSELLTDPDFVQTLVRRRIEGERNQFGEWVSDAPSNTPVIGAWQKASDKEIVQMDLGEIKQEIRKLLTITEIKVSEDDDKLSDRIIDGSNRYKVLKVGDNIDNGFYRAFASFEGVE